MISMQLKECPRKIKVRRVGRALYAVIPQEIARELKIEAGESAIILLDQAQYTIAYKFKAKEVKTEI